jgi:tRNA(His) guanylyltransferase
MSNNEEDSLGDRMKFYEGTGELNLLPLIPVIARLDGKAFHTFTKGLQRPYDKRLTNLMVDTTKYLVDLSNACIGYTQSDEITLIFLKSSFNTDIFMGSRHFKMVSLLASYATAYFNRNLFYYLPEKINNCPVFDCRVWNVPSTMEACNCLIWREQDATRNSIQMAGQAFFSHNQLMNKSCDEIQEMLFQQKNINWNDYPAFFKRGTYVRRVNVSRKFTIQELDKLPPQHEARKNPDLMVERKEIQILDMPIFTKIVNREAVVFEGAEPVIQEE